jgi:hypothetical protein
MMILFGIVKRYYLVTHGKMQVSLANWFDTFFSLFGLKFAN